MSHLRELLPAEVSPLAHQEALRFLKEGRDKAIAEVMRLRRELGGVVDVLSHQTFSLAVRVTLAEAMARAALLYGPHTRPRRRRLSGWWDRAVRARWQTWMARRGR